MIFYDSKELLKILVLAFQSIQRSFLLPRSPQRSLLMSKKVQQSLMYVLQQDINNLDEDFDTNLLSKDGQHPKILRAYQSKQIHPETLIMINEVTNVFRYWDKKLVDKIIWPDIKRQCIKYRPFLAFDADKVKTTIVNTFRNTSQYSAT